MMTTAISGRVLLLSSDDEPLSSIEHELTAAGYDVRRCHEAGGQAFPCQGLAGGTCPLEAEGGVDVAVDVRQHPWPHPTLREVGVICALRADVPLLVIGRHAHPFEPWATATLEQADGIAARCEQAIDSALERARVAVVDAVRAVFANHGFEGSFAVDVQRRLGRLYVTIAADVPSSVRGMAATRSADALRKLDHTATALEIEFVELV